jgi:MFS family permease
MFYISSLIAFISIFILLRLKESLKNPERFKVSLLLLKKNEIFDVTAIAPALVVVFIYYCFGGFLTIIPDQSVHLGIANKGIFFTVFTIFSIFSRLFAGRASDRLGRVMVIRFAIISLVLSLIYVSYADTALELMISAGFLGFSTGVAAPAVFAWAIDRSAEHNRGKALATVYIALEVGIGLGSVFSAWIYSNNPSNFYWVMMVSAIITFLAYLYLILWNKRKSMGLTT